MILFKKRQKDKPKTITKEKLWLVLGHIQINFFQTLYNDKGQTTVHFDTSLDDLDFHSRSQFYEKAKPSAPIFSVRFQSISRKSRLLAQSGGLLKLILILFCMVNIQGRELYFRDFIRCTFYIGLCPDTFEPVCFKLGMMLGTTMRCSVIQV